MHIAAISGIRYERGYILMYIRISEKYASAFRTSSTTVRRVRRAINLRRKGRYVARENNLVYFAVQARFGKYSLINMKDLRLSRENFYSQLIKNFRNFEEISVIVFSFNPFFRLLAKLASLAS